MSNHTPGPWDWEQGIEGNGEPIPGLFVIGITTNSPKYRFKHLGSTYTAEDARLIAAAPDLLKACEQARACLLNLMPDKGPVNRQMKKMVGELSVVITQAGGE